ncbi:MAG: DUF4290 domain-containing protein [Bacteroidales bacterium]
MDYNTQREKLLMPEYGRHVQEMINYVKNLPDKDKRNEQIQAVVAVMGTLNPQLRDINDFKHKLWDHVQIISDFKIDIESPYPTPTKETLYTKPNCIPLQKTPIKAAHYGRNIQNMIEIIAVREDDEIKAYMIKTLASYMKQQYLIWNKDSVSEETIFKDIYTLSGGRITVPADIHIGMGQLETPIHSRSTIPAARSNNYRNNINKGKGNNNNNKRWKNNK